MRDRRRLPGLAFAREGIAGQKRHRRWYTSEAAVRRYQQEVIDRAVPVDRPRRDGA